MRIQNNQPQYSNPAFGMKFSPQTTSNFAHEMLNIGVKGRCETMEKLLNLHNAERTKHLAIEFQNTGDRYSISTVIGGVMKEIHSEKIEKPMRRPNKAFSRIIDYLSNTEQLLKDIASKSTKK